jgi:tetratricopeptide (TPR) repeat protein
MFVTGVAAQWPQQGQVRGQGHREPGETAALEGRVNAHGGDCKNLQVVLADQSGSQIAAAQVSLNGTFSFSGVPLGQYTLRVLDGNKLISERYVSVDELVEQVDLELPRDRGENQNDGTVSVSELQHRIPAKALKEAQNGESALRKGNVDVAIGNFERALGIDPDFAAVREELANLYLQKHDDARAVVHLEALLRQRRSSVWGWTSLCAAHFRLGQVAEAEAAARRALALDAAQKTSRYVLGISLASQGKNPDEALASLRETFAKYPRGHLAAAEILANRGDIAGARDELESYLGSHPPEDTSEVNAWLARHPQPRASAAESVPGAR